MDHCFIDITVEFLSVAIHNILYYSSIYPDSVFETRNKYSIVVYASIHPEINSYIEMCLRTIAECLKKGELTKVEFAVIDAEYKPITKFVFDFEKRNSFDETLDSYLVQCEQNMRAFCLSLSSTAYKFKALPEDASFSIYVHTNESAAVSLTTDSSLEDFPMIEIKQSSNEMNQIIPLRQFSIRSYNLTTYIEM